MTKVQVHRSYSQKTFFEFSGNAQCMIVSINYIYKKDLPDQFVQINIKYMLSLL